METQITPQWIDRYNNDELNPEERVLFEEFMKKDPLLLHEQKLDADLDQFMRDKELIRFMENLTDLPSKSDHKIFLRKVRFVASFLGMTLIIFSLIWICWKPHLQLGFKVDSISVRGMNNKIASRYLPRCTHHQPDHYTFAGGTRFIPPDSLETNAYTIMPEYELLIGSVFRGPVPEVILPEPVTRLDHQDILQFEWKSGEAEESPEYHSLGIVLTDNKGHKVREFFHLPMSGCFSMPADSLGRGLFYWKILMQDDIVKIGKVAVY